MRSVRLSSCQGRCCPTNWYNCRIIMSISTFQEFADAYCQVIGGDIITAAQIYRILTDESVAFDDGFLEFATGIMQDMQPNNGMKLTGKGAENPE